MYRNPPDVFCCIVGICSGLVGGHSQLPRAFLPSTEMSTHPHFRSSETSSRSSGTIWHHHLTHHICMYQLSYVRFGRSVNTNKVNHDFTVKDFCLDRLSCCVFFSYEKSTAVAWSRTFSSFRTTKLRSHFFGMKSLCLCVSLLSLAISLSLTLSLSRFYHAPSFPPILHIPSSSLSPPSHSLHDIWRV